jgi:hypothetical protein
MRLMGIVLAAAGLILAAYSFPFVTRVAFAFFLLGLLGMGAGLWMGLPASVELNR